LFVQIVYVVGTIRFPSSTYNRYPVSPFLVLDDGPSTMGLSRSSRTGKWQTVKTTGTVADTISAKCSVITKYNRPLWDSFRRIMISR